eukprot:17624-Eustigmatos_ZCMA.PRE.1
MEIAAKYHIPLVGVYSKDMLPSFPTPGGYIINLANADDANGTHWTCFFIERERGGKMKAAYFD